jgi:hypothetical protein
MHCAGRHYVVTYVIVRLAASISETKGVFGVPFLCLREGVVCWRRTFLLLVNIIYIIVSVTRHCCVLSRFSHPRGTLASRGRAAQTANGVTRARAPGLTSSAAPDWTGVRSCGLKLNAQFLYSIVICVLHYNPRHVSSNTILILRRSKLYCYSIWFPTVRPLTECDDTRCCNNTIQTS